MEGDENNNGISKEQLKELKYLFEQAAVEADVEGDHLVLTAYLGECYEEFARLPLLDFTHMIADIFEQREEKEELLAFVGLLGKMQMIAAEYIETDGMSHCFKVSA